MKKIGKDKSWHEKTVVFQEKVVHAKVRQDILMWLRVVKHVIMITIPMGEQIKAAYEQKATKYYNHRSEGEISKKLCKRSLKSDETTEKTANMWNNLFTSIKMDIAEP